MKQERLAFLADNPFDAKRFVFFVGRRCRASLIRDVAQELPLDWHTVKALEQQYMREQLRRAGTPGPRVHGVDEVSIRKGHADRIVVSDLVRQRPIWRGGTSPAGVQGTGCGTLRPCGGQVVPVPVFGIFEGGTIAGIAHGGAIAAARSLPYHCRFVGVAGTSAGAIAAALVAAGFTDDELKALFKELIQSAPLGAESQLIKLLKGYDWNSYKGDVRRLSKRLAKLDRAYQALRLRSVRIVWGLVLTFFTLLRSRRLIKKVWMDHGVFDVSGLEEWLDSKLGAKLADRKQPIQFSDLRIPLKVVAARVDQPGIQVFSRETTPDVPVAAAVGASICVPLLFKPVKVKCTLSGSRTDISCVDGGVVSNFPAWAFDNEIEETGLSIPALGFRLRTEVPRKFRAPDIAV